MTKRKVKLNIFKELSSGRGKTAFFFTIGRRTTSKGRRK